MGRGLLPRSDAGRPQTNHHCLWEAGPGHQGFRKQADQAAKQLRAISLEDGEERLLALSYSDSAATLALRSQELFLVDLTETFPDIR